MGVIQDTVTLISAASGATTSYIEGLRHYRLIGIQVDGSASAAGTVAVAISLNSSTFDTIHTFTLGASSCNIIHIENQPCARIRITATPSAGTCTVTYALGHGW